jgi:hypothetical protein
VVRQLRLRPYKRILPGCEAIVQPCPYKTILQPTGNLCRWRANDAGRDMTFIKIKVFDTCAEIIGYAVLNACTGRPGAIGYGRTVLPAGIVKLDRNSPAAPPAVP